MERKIRLIHTGVRRKVEPGQGFPPLMEDTRANNLASVEVSDSETVYVKAIAGPYVATDGLHVMVLPDLSNQRQIREVTDISVTHLSKVLEHLKQQPVKMVIRAAYQPAKPSEWIAERAHIPAVALPFSVGGTQGATDLFGLFNDTITRLLAGLNGK
jgi:hypothetical protein